MGSGIGAFAPFKEKKTICELCVFKIIEVIPKHIK